MTDQPEKMPLTSMDIAAEKREALKQLFPEVFAEDRIDFDQLKRVLGDWVEPGKERFGLTWPGKAECMRIIQSPSVATLKPVREESVNFDETENVFIEGDNLEVLKLLQKAYFGKVKMIYIDPPYNTGKEFIYPDRYNEDLDTYLQYTGQQDSEGRKFSTNTDAVGRFHSNWLNMMYPRLYLARNLLREDGIVLISIDENEFHNLKKLADEVFGETNYAGEIVWKNSSKNDQAYISIQHEYILVYVRNKDVNKGVWEERKEGLEDIYKAFDSFRAEHGNDWDAIHKAALAWYKQFPEANPITSSKHYSWMDERGVYFPDNISGPNDGQYVYEVLHPETGKPVKQPSRGWFCPEENLRRLIADNRVHFGKDETTVPCLKTYLKGTENISVTSLKIRDSRAASNRLRDLFGEKVFTNPKDELLLKDLFKAMDIKEDDIVLDYFAGSGSTAHAVVELNRDTGARVRYVAVQLPEKLDSMLASATGAAKKITKNAIDYLTSKGRPLTISEIAKERLRLVGEQIQSSNSNTAGLFEEGQALDLGFKVYALDQTNFAIWRGEPEKLEKQIDLHVQNVDPSATPEDIVYELLLKAGFPLITKVQAQKMAGKTIYSVEDGALLICLDKEITPALIDALAEADPLQVICLDEGFKGNDQLKANAVQTFKARAASRETEIVFRTV
ncbi:MAG: site-specific DNA-methyltransferase [Hyphomonas sp.]|uniref:site-specific DNA-methyltransferase n=1 Tax=Hyphomonas sp. TaxID=87 RepID=UPI001B296B69|nr:site-specific DNA-methyltransferase [Hyphomonas sp.]MBO6582544.1 site-specific DNA-methyltransferase [Hyphomonas sp.]